MDRTDLWILAVAKTEVIPTAPTFGIRFVQAGASPSAAEDFGELQAVYSPSGHHEEGQKTLPP